ncbi:L-2,4-diaminobutyrate transaminase [Kordiimonas lacus]|uniref:L-2,4-diaminobutyrate transaminase n=2 Tax=Kordiimonas lacus TaxID=637679 RepID=A0A1G6VEC7_9PROT|nr:aminotransferase [Kordiimonas lacus]SDD52040.1 L-2,4-diaminobutyrate transaminase [Kordiimonas lacus]
MHDIARQSQQKIHKQKILHPATSICALEADGPRKIADAQGIHVTDADGHKAIDGIAGLWCANVGHGRAEIADAMRDAALKLDYFHTFGGHTNDMQEALADELIAMAPEGLSHVFFGCSGSDANDTLVKIAWQYNAMRGKPEKRKIISRWQAYHGTSISTASLTGLKSFHKAFGLPLDFVKHTDFPHFYSQAEDGEDETAFSARLLSRLEQLIEEEGADTIASFIGEPIMGAGGVVTPPEGYWQGIQDICRRNDILIIADEVVCGYGRTGHNFGSGLYGIKPDMMATAKGLTAGIFPMSAAFISHEIHDVMRTASRKLGGFSHGYTYSGHPVGAAVALKVLEIMKREQLVENAATTGAYFHQQLREAFKGHAHVGEIRGAGLVAAIQLMADADSKTFLDPTRKLAAKVSEECYRRGLVTRPLPTMSSLALSPPLTLARGDVDDIVEITKAGIDAVMAAGS